MARRILVVDDESHILHVLSLKLRNAGYEVLIAQDGEEALDVALRERPDLIITDYQMPYMTGLELCKALSDKGPHAGGDGGTAAGTPVVMLTARGYALDSEDLTLKNIREVVSKPFSPRAIVELIARILSEEPVRDEGRSEPKDVMSVSGQSPAHHRLNASPSPSVILKSKKEAA